eukprot:c17583_g1_i1.p1 GENE.c17583_g1_i1~~c17583_g1_i1.p1  ORF type:complete len:486 (+),score=119.83 c17583_g1_i1:261-1718(+)
MQLKETQEQALTMQTKFESKNQSLEMELEMLSTGKLELQKSLHEKMADHEKERQLLQSKVTNLENSLESKVSELIALNSTLESYSMRIIELEGVCCQTKDLLTVTEARLLDKSNQFDELDQDHQKLIHQNQQMESTLLNEKTNHDNVLKELDRYTRTHDLHLQEIESLKQASEQQERSFHHKCEELKELDQKLNNKIAELAEANRIANTKLEQLAQEYDTFKETVLPKAEFEVLTSQLMAITKKWEETEASNKVLDIKITEQRQLELHQLNLLCEEQKAVTELRSEMEARKLEMDELLSRQNAKDMDILKFKSQMEDLQETIRSLTENCTELKAEKARLVENVSLLSKKLTEAEISNMQLDDQRLKSQQRIEQLTKQLEHLSADLQARKINETDRFSQLLRQLDSANLEKQRLTAKLDDLQRLAAPITPVEQEEPEIIFARPLSQKESPKRTPKRATPRVEKPQNTKKKAQGANSFDWFDETAFD